MARSKRIYLVMRGYQGGWPVAAFTVKHELASWLAKNSRGNEIIYRMKDNPDNYMLPEATVRIDANTLKAL